MTLSAAERRAIRRSQLFLVLADATWFYDAHSQAQAAYAQQCGIPFRVLVFPGVRVPETAFLGMTDLRLVQSQGVAADKAQIQAWLEEVACSTAHGSRRTQPRTA